MSVSNASSNLISFNNSVDWRSVLGEVKDQGECANCWTV